MNLLFDAWVPVQMPDGTRTKVTPQQVPGSGAVCIDHPRADFSALITELLVCIFQTLSAPKNDSQRLALLSGRALPDVSEWTNHSAAFDVFSNGLRFMQEPTPAEGKDATMAAAGLLYEFPANNTQELNKDFFQSRYGDSPLCPHCTPVALFLNQSHARMGGNGYKTGPRETSVLTALLRGENLWKTICLNLLSVDWFDAFSDDPQSVGNDIAGSFPWMFPEHYYQHKRTVTLSTVGKFGSLWWSPVALHLNQEANPLGHACFCCGEVWDQMVFTATKRSTPAYLEGATRHPHTGWSTVKKTGLGRAVEVPADGFTFEHWQALTVGVMGPASLPAWNQRTWKDKDAAQLWVFGYQMRTMTPVYWLDERAPVLVAAEGVKAGKVQDMALELLGHAEKAVKALGAALYFNPKTIHSEFPPPRLLMPKESATLILWQQLSPLAMAELRVSNLTGDLGLRDVAAFVRKVREVALLTFDRSLDDAADQPAVAAACMARRAKLETSLTPKSKSATKMRTPTAPAVTALPTSAESFVVNAVRALRESGNPLFYRLKRGTELLDAMLEPIFHEVKAQLRAHRMFEYSDDQIASALLLVARLAEEPGSTPLMRKLAGTGKADKKRYSDLRFANLVRSEGVDELLPNLRRAVRYCGDKVEPYDLVRTVFGWSDDAIHATRKRLIAQFHGFE